MRFRSELSNKNMPQTGGGKPLSTGTVSRKEVEVDTDKQEPSTEEIRKMIGNLEKDLRKQSF